MTARGRARLDRTLVARGLAADLDAAHDLVRAGMVLVSGAPATTTARLVATDEPVVLLDVPRFVGRGGEKLDGALEGFGIDVTGRLAIDLGASTGGFTDCLLARGARRVLAVDVGRNQLHERLRRDPRVVSWEGTNLEALGAVEVREALGGEPGVVTADLSFTSMATHAPAIVALAGVGDVVALIKPQFEVSHAIASRGSGVVRDPADWTDAIERCASAFLRAGAGIMDLMASPLHGASGNAEFFVHARPRADGLARDARAALVAAVVGTAAGQVTTVLLVVHGTRADAVAMAEATRQRLVAQGVTAVVAALEGHAVAATLDGAPDDADLIVSLGGDGTFLRASRLAREARCPVLGVNFGRLGYLLEVAPEEFDAVLDDALAGRALVEERLGLHVAAPGLDAFALNELALEKTVAGHMVRVAASVNGEHLLTYAADGIIVATPTGSTAYNLSAGGPVVSPSLDALLLTPVAPHFTIDRSIVLSPDETVALAVLPDRPAVLVADGSTLATLQPGDSVTVSRDPVPVRVVVGSRHGVGGRLRASLREGHR